MATYNMLLIDLGSMDLSNAYFCLSIVHSPHAFSISSHFIPDHCQSQVVYVH